MSDTRKYCQAIDFYLSGSGITATATSLTLTAMTTPDGTVIVMSDIGTLGYLTLEPSTANEENVSFTGITQNANGTATVSGLTRGLRFVSPYTQDTSLRNAHAGGTTVRITNSAPFYNDFANKENNETIAQQWTFPNDANTPVLGTVYAAPTTDLQVASKKYVDDTAVSGAPDANETTKGIVQLATNAQMGTATSTGSTGARLIPPNDQLASTSAGAGDAHKIPTLNSSGKLDQTLMTNASTTVSGTVEIATAAETAAGTATGGSGATLVPANSSFLQAASSLATNASKVPVADTTGVVQQAWIDDVGTSGEAITAGQGLYLKASDSKVYKSIGTGDEATFSFCGIATTTVAGADLAVRFARPGQTANGLSGLTAGAYYFVTDTAGTLGTTPGSRFAKVGQAMSTTSMRVIEPKFIVSGVQVVSSATTYAQTTGFYPARVLVKASTDSNFSSFAPVFSFGDDTNTCILGRVYTSPSNTSVSQYDSTAFHIQTDNSQITKGTLTTKTATGFTIDASSHGADVRVFWTAYSE